MVMVNNLLGRKVIRKIGYNLIVYIYSDKDLREDNYWREVDERIGNWLKLQESLI